jgi:hypothetical protein
MTGAIPSSDQVGIAGAVDPGVVNSDEAMPPVSHDPPITEGRPSQLEAAVSSDNTSLHGVVDMDVDTQTEVLTRAPQPNELLAGHPVDPAALQEIIQNVVNNVNRLIASVIAFDSHEKSTLKFLCRMRRHPGLRKCFSLLP